MATFEIRKKTSHVWEHLWDDAPAKDFLLSSGFFSITDTRFELYSPSGGIQRTADLSEIVVFDDTDASTPETFTTRVGFALRMVQLEYPYPQVDSSLSSSLPSTAFGDLRTAELHPQFQGSFEYTVDNTDLTVNSTTASATITQASGMAVLTTTTTTGGMAMLLSKQHARYKSGLGGVLRFTALFTAPVAATEQYVGLADEMGSSEAFENGYIIGYDGTTFGYHRFRNDTKTTTAIADWDDPLDGSGDSGSTIDQTKLNVFYIQYQYLGAGAINIFFEKQNGNVVLVHTDKYAGINTEPSTHNPNFLFTMHVDNKATTSNIIIKSSSFSYFVEGKTSFIELHQPQNSSGIKEKTAVTTEVAIFTIRNKTSYQSKTNFIDILLENVGTSIEASSANNLGSFRLVRDATLGGTPSFSDINTANSVVEIDTAGTTVTGGKEILSGPLAGKNDSATENLLPYKLIVNPGETITLAGISAQSATMQGTMLWKELF